MSSLDHRQNRADEQHHDTSPLPLSGSGAQQSSIEQIAFPEYTPVPSGILPIASLDEAPSSQPDPDTAPVRMTKSVLSPAPAVTRALTEQYTDSLSTSSLQSYTTTGRQPIVIRGTGKISVSHRPPESRRKPIMHVIATVVLALVVVGALLSVVPLGGSNKSSLFKSIIDGTTGQMNISSVRNNNTALIAQQAATATVVTQDGYDPGAQVYMGVPTPPPVINNPGGSMSGTGGTGTINTGTGGIGTINTGTGGTISTGTSGLNSFFYGQCTYWANMRYHALTGHYTDWIGNANEWYVGALNAGWHVSSQPHVPSIIVLQAYVQGAGAYGHVAVVESISSPGVVYTSGWNWANRWAALSYVNFTYPAAGVAFVWHD